MKNWKHQKSLPVYIAAVALLVSGCGSSSTSFLNSAANASNANFNNVIDPFPTPSPSASTAALPAITYGIENTGINDKVGTCTDCLTGSGGNYPTWSTYGSTGTYINTDDLLQVQVTVQPGGALSASGIASGDYSGFTASYNCASFEVSIYDNQGDLIAGPTPTGMLAVQGSQGCMTVLPPSGESGTTSSQATTLLDFSGNLNGPHGPLNVEVVADQYDFYCKLWANIYDELEEEYGIYAAEYDPYYGDYNYWCPSKTVYKNHSISASLQINVNGTTLQ